VPRNEPKRDYLPEDQHHRADDGGFGQEYAGTARHGDKGGPDRPAAETRR